MDKISTGIKDLDSLIDSAYIGDNMVWETEAGTSDDIFILNFIKRSLSEDRDVIYVSFNRSPQSILLHMDVKDHPERLTVLDCFTSGKGKSDRAFLKFYESKRDAYPKIIRVNRPGDISFFSETVNSIQDGLAEGARYIFDSLTGMQDLWGEENNTYKFFTYMCPRLYDLRTVAYWMLEKEAHSQAFKANLRHITQVVIDLSKKKEKLFLKALKLEGRSDREAFKPHLYEIEDSGIRIVPVRKEPSLNIGSKIKETRTRLGMSQKDLADKIGLTSSFVSQIESNQISPSLNSFLQIANALGINPTMLLHKEKRRDDAEWLLRRVAVMKNVYRTGQGYRVYTITDGGKTSAYTAVIAPGVVLNKHFLDRKKEELIFVVRGRISVNVENKERELREGDSVFLKEAMPDIWQNKTKEEVELLALCT